VVLATLVLAVAARQHVRFLRSLGTREIPRGYGTWLPTFTAAALAVTAACSRCTCCWKPEPDMLNLAWRMLKRDWGAAPSGTDSEPKC
jgi:hypothetical protein